MSATDMMMILAPVGVCLLACMGTGLLLYLMGAIAQYAREKAACLLADGEHHGKAESMADLSTRIRRIWALWEVLPHPRRASLKMTDETLEVAERAICRAAAEISGFTSDIALEVADLPDEVGMIAAKASAHFGDLARED